MTVDDLGDEAGEVAFSVWKVYHFLIVMVDHCSCKHWVWGIKLMCIALNTNKCYEIKGFEYFVSDNPLV